MVPYRWTVGLDHSSTPLLQLPPVSLTWVRSFSLQTHAIVRLLRCMSLSSALYCFFNRDLPHHTAGKAVAVLHFHEVSTQLGLASSLWCSCLASVWHSCRHVSPHLFNSVSQSQSQSKGLPDNKYSVDICLLNKWKLSKYSTHFSSKELDMRILIVQFKFLLANNRARNKVSSAVPGLSPHCFLCDLASVSYVTS